VERRRKMARPHRMAHKFQRLAHKERGLDSEATRVVKDGGISQLSVRHKVPILLW
jgi:hypothetical protein